MKQIALGWWDRLRKAFQTKKSKPKKGGIVMWPSEKKENVAMK
jgi:hypothetical protein